MREHAKRTCEHAMSIRVRAVSMHGAVQNRALLSFFSVETESKIDDRSLTSRLANERRPPC